MVTLALISSSREQKQKESYQETKKKKKIQETNRAIAAAIADRKSHLERELAEGEKRDGISPFGLDGDRVELRRAINFCFQAARKGVDRV